MRSAYVQIFCRQGLQHFTPNAADAANSTRSLFHRQLQVMPKVPLLHR